MPSGVGASRVRRLVSLLGARGVVIALVVGAPVLWLAFHDGGYFPVTWNVTAVVLLGLVVVVLLTRAEISLGPLGVALVSGLSALLLWTLLSAIWSIAPAASILEGQRTLLYLVGGVAVLIVSDRHGARPVTIAVLGALTVICAYALADRLGTVSPLPYNRLGGSVGYWNSLGMLAAAGACLALAVAAHERSALARGLAGGALPAFVVALYLTFSRGAFVALGLGLAVSAAVDPRRRELASAGVILALPCLAVLACGAGAHALTTPGAPLAAVTADAHRLGVLMMVICVASAWLATRAPLLGSRLPALPVRPLAVVVVASAVLVALIITGGPSRLPGAAASAFQKAPPNAATDQAAHLSSLSGSWRGEMWHVALSTFARHPLAGNGAGTYGRLWLMNRHDPITVQDAHSLYLETLSELGIVGLALLLSVLFLPLLAARRRFTSPYVPALLATYVAFLAHAAIDWDWEMPVVTMTALMCGAAIVAGERRRSPPLGRGIRAASAAVPVVLAGCGLVLLVGNRRLDSAAAAAASGQNTLAAQATAAQRWVPWSPDPPRWLATFQLDRGNRPQARRLLAAAIARDQTDWSLWLEMAAASNGAARSHAIKEAVQLNPRGPELFISAVRYGLFSRSQPPAHTPRRLSRLSADSSRAQQ